MKVFILLSALLVSTCAASLYGPVSSQYQHLDPHGHTYAYGYSDPNSQKHETRSHDGVTHGSYSYVDDHGHVHSTSYTADPHHGFHASGTDVPKAPADPHGHVHYASAHPYEHYHHHDSHAYPQHIPTLTHGGVPVDTPEVQHAKAAHFAAYAAAAAAAGHDDHHHHHHLYKRSLYAGPWGYGGHNHVALTHGGVPVDAPDVQAAKAEHFAAHAKALGHVGHAHGAPVETPEVQHAKAAHFAAHAAARSGHDHHGYGAPAAHGAASYHVPVIHNGVPVETPEVQHAKAAHFAAVAEASSRAGHGHDHGQWEGDNGHWNGVHNDYSGGYQNGYGHGHSGPIHIPVIHNGVPVEPAEVQHARAAHLSALAAASHGSHGGDYHHGGHDGGYHQSHYEDDGQYHPHYDHHY